MGARTVASRTIWAAAVVAVAAGYLTFNLGHDAVLTAWGGWLLAVTLLGGATFRYRAGSHEAAASTLPLLAQGVAVTLLVVGAAVVMAFSPMARAEPFPRVFAAWPLLVLFPGFWRGLAQRVRGTRARRLDGSN